MAAQEHVTLARSLVELFNHRHSDPAWLDKSLAAFAADCEVVDAAAGTTFHGPEGYRRVMRFFVENFPDLRMELTKALATEDHGVFEGTYRWANSGPPSLPSAALKASGHAGGVRMCKVFQVRHGKILSLHCYYDMTTLLEYFGLVPATAEAT